MARKVFNRMLETGQDARAVVAAEGLVQVADESRIEAWVDEVVREHPVEVQRLKAGEERLMGFFMGRIMKRSAGKADPRLVAELIRSRVLG
jgi:aspartyl-tRNA(Asn)/glutamyl-tRNA(Gln) amidotransferase subunit B